jgi:hypothetical protein
MENRKKFFLFALMTAAAVAVYSQQQYDPEKDFMVSLHNGGKSIMITVYTGSKQTVRIPPVIQGLPVTHIGDKAFYYYTDLAGVTIPDSVTSIGEKAFFGCTSLANVTIPNSVTGIGEKAFSGCTSLTSINIPNNVTSIEISAFSGCASLTSIVLPNSDISIGDWAFDGCTSLTLVFIPNSVIRIEAGAFSGCTSLTSINIPSSVTSIGIGAFSGCASLTAIHAATDNNAYTDVNGVLYTKNKTSLIAYPAGISGEFTIPNSVTIIEENAFGDCNRLTGVTIPRSVTSIGDSAFDGCASLAGVTFQGAITSGNFHVNAFYRLGDLRAKFYAANSAKGTPGTYTTTTPVGGRSVWAKQ